MAGHVAGRNETAERPVGSALERAGHFVWLTARVLEQRRFALHFLDGDADALETALLAYRNEDDGYGHALDPDLRGPSSQPLHAVHALRLLDEAGRCGGQRVERLCRYLTAVSTPDGALPVVSPTPPGHPRAPWFPATDRSSGGLLATGPVVGALHGNGVWHAWLFRATDCCWAAVDALEKPHPGEALAALAFLDSVPDRARAEAAAARLGRLVRDQGLAVLDPGRDRATGVGTPREDTEEGFFAYDFARSPESLGRRWFSDAEIDRSLDFLTGSQQPDGGWPLRRRPWAAAPRMEWRPVLTIEALLTLRAYGRPIA
ncbi:hypothetical protein [Streptomyces sp. ICBB 8177]|uniref:hypothetical protein n=1 Tax=Streptomyces sp. ICBB 8177 TaxID=563922 RepID=UPI000D674CDA|nr:hypothetical protein [Streptomyces sp. ICBB 8177]PWI45163.1 hypothetical protein CK485_03115 [Streptomyces sp. ICBB 8177]